MRKILCLLFAALVFVLPLTGCASPTPSEGKLSVVVTVFAEYDWVKNVLGDSAETDVTLLLDNGVDLHSYQPTAADIIRIASCDLFVYVGGESDEWAEAALREPANPNRVVLNLLDILGEAARTEETVEGMEAEEEGEETELDEHVWLSLRNAALFTEAIRDAMISLDAENADLYRANAETYCEKLKALDTRYTEAVAASAGKTLLFADRFPFRYLTDDYGLTYYAAFSGCSAESEASFETVSFLASKVDELNLPCVLTTEGSSHKIAETVVASTSEKSAKILSLDSLQSVTAADVEKGVTYLSVAEKNLAVLKEALN